MKCFLDRPYCDTTQNKCLNTKCTRHLDNNNRFYSLKTNVSNLPVAKTDFSKNHNVCPNLNNEIKQ